MQRGRYKRRGGCCRGKGVVVSIFQLCVDANAHLYARVAVDSCQHDVADANYEARQEANRQEEDHQGSPEVREVGEGKHRGKRVSVLLV